MPGVRGELRHRELDAHDDLAVVKRGDEQYSEEKFRGDLALRDDHRLHELQHCRQKVRGRIFLATKPPIVSKLRIWALPIRLAR